MIPSLAGGGLLWLAGRRLFPTWHYSVTHELHIQKRALHSQTKVVRQHEKRNVAVESGIVQTVLLLLQMSCALLSDNHVKAAGASRHLELSRDAVDLVEPFKQTAHQ